MKFHLEISARQTGKSTRLIDRLNTLVSIDKLVKPVVFSDRMESSKNLKHLYESKYGKNDSIKFINIGNNGDNIRGRNTPYFFDEFDFYKGSWLYNIAKKDLKNCYFCTTAIKYRTLKEVNNKKSTDALVKLIQWNNFEYETYANSDNSTERYSRLLNTYPPIDVFNIEILGNFIKNDMTKEINL